MWLVRFQAEPESLAFCLRHLTDAPSNPSDGMLLFIDSTVHRYVTLSYSYQLKGSFRRNQIFDLNCYLVLP